MTLDDESLSETCEIKIETDNKWITLIQNTNQRK